MREPGRKTKYRISRIFALLLIVTLAAGLLPPRASATDVDGAVPMPDSSTGTIRAYDWHRVNVVKDLPPAGTVCPVLILWQSNNTIYYATGGYAGQVDMGGRILDWDAVGSGSWSTGDANLPNPFAGGATDIMTFRTWEKMTSWEMEVTGRTDGDNKNAPVVRFYPYANCMITGYDDFDFDSKQPVSYSKSIKDAYDLWTLYTSELGGDGAEGLPGGRVRIFDNVPGTDTCFKEKDQYLVGWCSPSSAKKYGNFIMYWGEERNLSAITDDYTIAEGQVMNVDDGVILMDGKKLTIEPGGMLSIEGTFYNNGYIENRGTIILQENACVRSSPDVNDAAGKILCSGARINRKDIAEEWIAVLQEQVYELSTEILWRCTLIETAEVFLSSEQQVAEKQAIVDAADHIRDQANLLEYEAEEDKAEAAKKDAEAVKRDAEAVQKGTEAEEKGAEAASITKDANKLREDANKLREEAKTLRKDKSETAQAKADAKDAEAATKDAEADKKDAEAENITKDAAKLQEEARDLLEDAKKLREDAKKLREDAEKKQAEAKAKREEYYDATAAAQSFLDKYISSLGRIDDMKNENAAQEKSIETLNKDIERYQKVTDEWVSGDGNLILLSGAKLALGDGAASGFRIETGANVTCHGYIISPHMIIMDSAKLKIGKNGVLFCGYTYPAKDMNLPQLEPQKPGTLDVTFNGLTKANSIFFINYEEENALNMYGDYVFEVDGVFRYSAKGAFHIATDIGGVARSYYTDPNYGHGLWKTYVDPNAPHDDPGNPDEPYNPGSDEPHNPGPYGPY